MSHFAAFKKISLGGALLVGLLLSGCGLSLAEDITPPPNYRPPVQAETQPAEVKTVFPVLPPDPAQGQAIYAEKCLPCHGESGMGDGPQASNLPNPAAPIGNAELAFAARPVDWYAMVTEGNLERFMPGFTESLNDRQRWDVVAYALTLSTNVHELGAGKALYEENCASCHGLTGKGDGSEAASLSTKPASWDDQSRLAELSLNDLAALVKSGAGEMPAFEGTLDDAQSLAVSAYVRSLSFAGSEELAAAPPVAVETLADADATPSSEDAPSVDGTPAAEDTPAAGETPASAELSKITITGKVSNGTPGGKVPEELDVMLTAYLDMAPAFEQSTTTGPDGSYRFEDVDYQSGYVYFVQAQAGALMFNSDILHGSDVQGDQADLPVVIYDTTSDASVLRTDRLHVFFDFSQPGLVQVINLYIVSNPSGKVVAAPAQGQPVISFELPEGATNLQFEDSVLGERYVQTENGFGDTNPITAGEGAVNQVLFAFDMPYNGSLDYSMKVPMPVESAVVMVPSEGITLKSDQLIDAGQNDMQGISLHMYQVNALESGDAITFSLKGSAETAVGAVTPASNNTALFVGAGAFGLALIGVGYYLFRQRARSQALEDEEEAGEALEGLPVEDGETSETLLDAIVALDDQHAAGGLAEAAYQERRAELKARLAEVLLREKEG